MFSGFENRCFRATLPKRPAYSSTWVSFKHKKINLLWYTERLLIQGAFADLFSREIPYNTLKSPLTSSLKTDLALTVDCDIGQWSPRAMTPFLSKTDPVLPEVSLTAAPAHPTCTAAAETHIADCASLTEPGLVCMRTRSVWCGRGPIIHSLIANS